MRLPPPPASPPEQRPESHVGAAGRSTFAAPSASERASVGPIPLRQAAPRPTSRRARLVAAAAAVVGLAAGAAAGVGIGFSIDDDADPAAATSTAVAGATPAGVTPELVSDEADANVKPGGSPVAGLHGTLDVYNVVQQISASIVTISSTVTETGPTGTATGEAVGTGVVVSADGEILTNNHVIEGATEVRVRFAGQTEPTPATVAAADPANDLALLRIDVGRELQPVTFADPAEIRIGDEVMAIGYALGLGGDPTVTTGIVSALNRTMISPAADGAGINSLDGLVQTDAAISSGNSGGPLVNAAGQVVGINTAVIVSGEGISATNVGFAIGSGEVQRVLEQLRSGTARVEGYLGITAEERVDGGQGALVTTVEPGSPAEEAGIGPGDVIVQVDDSPVTDAGGVIAAIRDRAPGEQVPIVVVRNGEQQTLTVTLDARPTS